MQSARAGSLQAIYGDVRNMKKNETTYYKNKMSKAKGYSMLVLLAIGVVMVWAALSSFILFVLGAASIYASYWLYADHLKKGGMSIQEAIKEKKK